MYRLQPDPSSDQGQGHDQASTSMLPPVSTSSFRHDQHPQHQHQHQHQQHQYPFAFDPAYAPPHPGGTSTSIPAFDYSYTRGPQGEMQPPLPVNIDTMSNAFGHDPSAGWGSPYHGPGMGSAPMAHDRSGERGEHNMQAWGGEGQMYADYTGQGDAGRDNRHGVSGGDWGKGSEAWGNEYARPGVNDVGIERELENLRLNLNDLVESIRPYASSPANPTPPRAPPYVQSRFVRLASTIQATLSSLQPHLHPYLHPEFNLLPPNASRVAQTQVGGATSSIKPLTAAEKEMEIIRKRRDMLIARAAQVQASSHPSAIHQQYAQQSPYSLQQSSSSGSSPHNPYPFNTTPSFNWKQGEFGGVYNGLNSNPMSNNNSGSPFTAAPFDGSPGMNTSRRSLTTMDSFDASLARFSLDPTKIGAEGVSKKATPEGGKCHGCGVGVTAEWRRGPDGPRSLCNACGLHYAKLTRKRAQEEASANNNHQAVTSI